MRFLRKKTRIRFAISVNLQQILQRYCAMLNVLCIQDLMTSLTTWQQVGLSNVIVLENLYAKLGFGRILKRSLSAKNIECKWSYFVTFKWTKFGLSGFCSDFLYPNSNRISVLSTPLVTRTKKKLRSYTISCYTWNVWLYMRSSLTRKVSKSKWLLI